MPSGDPLTSRSIVASLIVSSLAGGAGAARPEAPPAAPSLRALRQAGVVGVVSGKTIKLSNGRYEGAPVVPGGAERLQVLLLGEWTAAGELDGNPGEERVVLLALSSGGTGVRIALAAFGTRGRRIENLGTILVGDRVTPRGLVLEGPTIAVETLDAGPGDPLCCPGQASRRSYRLGPSGLAEMADVPFDLVHGQIVLAASVGEVDGLRFLLDTGSDPSAIDLETSARLGLPSDIRTSGTASGVGDGPATTHPSRIAGLRIGCESIAPMDAVALDLSAASRRLGVEIAGVLGYSFLKGRTVEVDYPGRRLRLHLEPPDDPAGALVTPLKLTDEAHTPLLENLIRVNDKVVPVTLDTGSSLALEVFPAARAILGPSLWQTPGRLGHLLGARGEVNVRHVKARSIAIGGWTLETTDLVLSDRAGETGARLGNLGNPALDTLVLTLDYRGGRIVFARTVAAGEAVPTDP